MIDSSSDRVSNAESVIHWFGEWPSFHDAEIVQICLDRSAESFVKVMTWQTTGQVDENGYYVKAKSCIVTFLFNEARDIQLQGFNHQNVISGLEVETVAEGIKLVPHPCFGVSGFIEAASIRVTIEPPL